MCREVTAASIVCSNKFPANSCELEITVFRESGSDDTADGTALDES